MFLQVFEVILSVLIFATFITQIIVPIWTNTILFPAFRRQRKTLERQLAEAKEKIALAEEEMRLRDLQHSAEEILARDTFTASPPKE